MDIFIGALFIIVCLMLIVVVLVQKGRGGGLGSAFGGAASSAFGTRVGDVFTWVTIVLTALFLLLAIGALMVFKPKPGVVATPIFRPAPAAYKDYAEPAYVEVLCGTPEAEIYYTVDGPVPQKDLAPSRRYSSPVRVEAGQTIRAVAYRAGGWTQSRMAEGYYGPPKEPVASAPAETQPVSAPAGQATATSAAGPPAAPARLPVAPASSPAGTMPAK